MKYFANGDLEKKRHFLEKRQPEPDPPPEPEPAVGEPDPNQEPRWR